MTDEFHRSGKRGAARRGLGVLALLIAASPALLAAEGVAAQDLCAGLKQAVEHAAQNFERLKAGPARKGPMGTSYPARSILLGGHSCRVVEPEPNYPGPKLWYTCRVTPDHATTSEVKMANRQNAAKVKACYPTVRETTPDTDIVTWSLSANGVGITLSINPLGQFIRVERTR